jgi:hypothetical protein
MLKMTVVRVHSSRRTVHLLRRLGCSMLFLSKGSLVRGHSSKGLSPNFPDVRTFTMLLCVVQYMIYRINLFIFDLFGVKRQVLDR